MKMGILFREKVVFFNFSQSLIFFENRGNLKQGWKCIMAAEGWTPLVPTLGFCRNAVIQSIPKVNPALAHSDSQCFQDSPVYALERTGGS